MVVRQTGAQVQRITAWCPRPRIGSTISAASYSMFLLSALRISELIHAYKWSIPSPKYAIASSASTLTILNYDCNGQDRYGQELKFMLIMLVGQTLESFIKHYLLRRGK
ncbi:hypothetical protein AVEN_214454-1 [Araneus ventricosus]|uniref:Uncharacterized protein n=1 Tax=Araneus ventricosus TaxID=182803 RepID=A0A4Y2CUL5_ARAVE|nr:hypothetical protein AVEN_214454-1 [Araneus ventricosus]